MWSCHFCLVYCLQHPSILSSPFSLRILLAAARNWYIRYNLISAAVPSVSIPNRNNALGLKLFIAYRTLAFRRTHYFNRQPADRSRKVDRPEETTSRFGHCFHLSCAPSAFRSRASLLKSGWTQGHPLPLAPDCAAAKEESSLWGVVRESELASQREKAHCAHLGSLRARLAVSWHPNRASTKRLGVSYTSR